MKAYKGFNKDMTCRGFQYKEGGEYETDRAELCERGFHACEAPLKVWDFYPPVDGNRFCKVEQDGSVHNEGADGKSVSTKIKIGAEIGISGLVKAHVEWCKEQTKAAIESRNAASGDSAQIGSSGDSAQIGSSGDSAQIGSSGHYAQIKCDGKNSVIACAGRESVVNASVGTWVCLSEYDIVDGKSVCVGMKAFRVDGKRYKADTWYTLKDGKVVEVEG